MGVLTSQPLLQGHKEPMWSQLLQLLSLHPRQPPLSFLIPLFFTCSSWCPFYNKTLCLSSAPHLCFNSTFHFKPLIMCNISLLTTCHSTCQYIMTPYLSNAPTILLHPFYLYFCSSYFILCLYCLYFVHINKDSVLFITDILRFYLIPILSYLFFVWNLKYKCTIRGITISLCLHKDNKALQCWIFHCSVFSFLSCVDFLRLPAVCFLQRPLMSRGTAENSLVYLVRWDQSGSFLTVPCAPQGAQTVAIGRRL